MTIGREEKKGTQTKHRKYFVIVDINYLILPNENEKLDGHMFHMINFLEIISLIRLNL